MAIENKGSNNYVRRPSDYERRIMNRLNRFFDTDFITDPNAPEAIIVEIFNRLVPIIKNVTQQELIKIEQELEIKINTIIDNRMNGLSDEMRKILEEMFAEFKQELPELTGSALNDPEQVCHILEYEIDEDDLTQFEIDYNPELISYRFFFVAIKDGDGEIISRCNATLISDTELEQQTVVVGDQLLYNGYSVVLYIITNPKDIEQPPEPEPEERVTEFKVNTNYLNKYGGTVMFYIKTTREVDDNE